MNKKENFLNSKKDKFYNLPAFVIKEFICAKHGDFVTATFVDVY